MGVLEDAIREHLDLKRQHGVPEEELERQEEEALGPARREMAVEGSPEAAAAGAEAPTALVDHAAAASEEPTALHEEPAHPDPAALREEAAAVDEPAAPRRDPTAPELAEPGGPAVERPESPPEHGVVDEGRTDRPAAVEPSQPEPPVDRPTEPPAAQRPPSPQRPVDQPAADEHEPIAAEPDEPRARDEPRAPDEDDLLARDEPRAPDEDDLLAHDEHDLLADDDPDDLLAEDDQDDPLAEGADGDVLEDTPDFLQDAPEHDRLWFEQKPPRDFDFE